MVRSQLVLFLPLILSLSLLLLFWAFGVTITFYMDVLIPKMYHVGFRTKFMDSIGYKHIPK